MVIRAEQMREIGDQQRVLALATRYGHLDRAALLDGVRRARTLGLTWKYSIESFAALYATHGAGFERLPPYFDVFSQKDVPADYGWVRFVRAQRRARGS